MMSEKINANEMAGRIKDSPNQQRDQAHHRYHHQK